jgi:acetyltransferase-like isoleucine patch superfamily enzyme
VSRFWNGKLSGLPGMTWELSGSAFLALRDRLSTVLRARNLAAAGPRVVIQAGAVIRNPAQISFGRGVLIGRDSLLTAERRDGRLVIGDETLLDKGCHVDFTGDVSIGRDCTLSAHVRLYSHDHGHDPRSQPNPRKLAIGDGVWIGTGATILQNVGTIGDGAIVAAGAVVTKPVPPRTLVGGNPASVIGPADDAGRGDRPAPA